MQGESGASDSRHGSQRKEGQTDANDHHANDHVFQRIFSRSRSDGRWLLAFLSGQREHGAVGRLVAGSDYLLALLGPFYAGGGTTEHEAAPGRDRDESQSHPTRAKRALNLRDPPYKANSEISRPADYVSSRKNWFFPDGVHRPERDSSGKKNSVTWANHRTMVPWAPASR